VEKGKAGTAFVRMSISTAVMENSTEVPQKLKIVTAILT
jgi:hypothetical protein